MKKKVLAICLVTAIVLLFNSTVYAMTGNELLTLCNPDDAEIITQYLDLNSDYPVITEPILTSYNSDDIIYEAAVNTPNGQKYTIIIVNGVIHVLKV
ncbi:MAG: hypothetical protein JW794_05990 [Candidatus Cloacimonetes bacterium]|nr:hypothetical protein [Candidatus Cloacimonadota bacterium]